MKAKEYEIMLCKNGNLYINKTEGNDFRSSDSKAFTEEDYNQVKQWFTKNIWHDASKNQPEIGKPFLNRAGNIGGVTVRIRDETQVLAGGNRWAYIEDILPDDCDKDSVNRLTILLNRMK